MQKYWEGVKRRSKICRRHRAKAAEGRLASIKEFCLRHGIEMTQTQHGWQFRKNEYVITWAPSSNRVSVQYALPGHGRTVPFAGDLNGRSKILAALEEVCDVTRSHPTDV